MQRLKTELFTQTYFFSLKEYDLFVAVLNKAKRKGGRIDVLFIDNGYGFEHTLRKIKI